MTVQEVWNRGNNLLATAVVVIAGFSFLPEFFLEDEWQHKLDEGLLFLLGLRALWWYRKEKNRFTRSILPLIFVIAGFAIKFLGVLLEIKDKEDVGDDFGGLILFALASMLVLWLYHQSKNIKEAK